ncbi:signal transducing histidine kinase, homodimeric domain protein [Candidatus Omnitrophus magneticus]|uniref:Chemotaxis protein CheA n=1 Tax=Candidatus Omnitrophus magneticus TaxID=1609969 RepID=A0A0F0CV95_9BACT|nr:signal transducing histidine kinase, homodimeric domain protein [Candidatus Omnitrophus magneticus]
MAIDKSKFLEQFKSETAEHLQNLNLGLLKLEKSPSDEICLKEMMREAHTIKGSSLMMGFKNISDIAHIMEDGLEKALNGKLTLGKSQFDILFKCLDHIEPLLGSTEENQTKSESIENLSKEAMKNFLDTQKEINALEKNIEIISQKAPASEYIPPKEKTIDKIIVNNDGKKSLPEENTTAEINKKISYDESIRVTTNKLNKLVNNAGELVTAKIRLNDIVKKIETQSEHIETLSDSFLKLLKDLKNTSETIDFLSSSIQMEIMKARMLPVSAIFNTFPRAIRDLAIEKGKKINFEIKGEETQLDKAILDEIKEPLIHLLRNAVDHGIEKPEERFKKNKNETGTIILSAYQEGSQVIIETSDDGNGINHEQVKKIAIQNNLISKEKTHELSTEEIYQFIFSHGFSTKEEVSDISGRGVGLSVVKDTINKLKGRLEIKSSPNGTTFIMRLPLTLVITESLIVSSGTSAFAIPIDSVIETIRIQNEDIKTIESKNAIKLRGRVIPVVNISEIFNLPKKGIMEKKFFPAVIIERDGKKAAIIVDEMLGRQEIIGKGIGEPLKNISHVAGATILGSGKVILILDVHSLVDKIGAGYTRVPTPKTNKERSARAKKNILLAEDTMSTALLEKNVLESVGYSVVIARDGKEALDRATNENFDIIISDVLMPVMNGFELVKNLRKKDSYKNTPIIIVTTRESEEDKKYGLESGADAYILKSEFTSDSFLETIERLAG